MTQTLPEIHSTAQQLERVCEQVLALARQVGADAAEVVAEVDQGFDVQVRLGEVETLEQTRNKGVSLTVYRGKHKGSASTGDTSESSLKATVEKAWAIARYTEADEYCGLADPQDLATQFPELSLDHPWDLSPQQAIELALEAETAGRDADKRIENSDGAGVSTERGVAVFATSAGFMATRITTGHSISCVLIARDENGMQRDHYYTAARNPERLLSPQLVGEEAARRTLAHLGARTPATTRTPVLFSPEMARGFIGHLVSACTGGAQYRQSSFLLGAAGQSIANNKLTLREQPFLPEAFGSTSFDMEGVAPQQRALVDQGTLTGYVLSSYSARRLGLRTTGNAGGVHNLTADAGELDQAGLLKQMGTGLLVTSVMGQGVNIVTGDYSRGASGFWVEDGEIAYPVQEVTIAGNLKEMLNKIAGIGNDVDLRGNIRSGSMLIDGMTLAGS
jgi:PmbA protein